MINVFLTGRDTQGELRFENGITRHTITRQGKGHFLERSFATIQEAKDFCEGELKRNPSDFYYLMEGDLIVETVLDSKFQENKQRRSELIFAVVSTAFFTLVGWGVSSDLFPGLLYARLVFALGVGALYAFFLLVTGRGNVEAAITMTILLILFGVAVGPIHEALKRNHLLNQTSGAPQPR